MNDKMRGWRRTTENELNINVIHESADHDTHQVRTSCIMAEGLLHMHELSVTFALATAEEKQLRVQGHLCV